MKLTWTEPAIADRLAIYEWLELKNPAAAAENDAKIADAAARLVHHPASGKTGRIAVRASWSSPRPICWPMNGRLNASSYWSSCILAVGGRRHSHPRSPSCSFSAFK
ncbi:type II toxin-antitoxin system RelE/ParE family toxin [Serratia marcescens]